MDNNEITNINLNELNDFPNHPFKVNDDDSYKTLKESIKEKGVLEPIIVRKKDDKSFEIISGHRRVKACRELGINKINAIIKDITYEEAIFYMVDSNIHREYILPSEKAYAYKMKLDAIKHQGRTLSPVGTKSHSVDELDDTKTQIYRYIRLTYLIPELLEYVDNSVKNRKDILTMGLRSAVELSYLSKEKQYLVADAIEFNQATPSHAQTIKIRKLAEKGTLTKYSIDDIFFEEKGNQHEKISFNKEKILKHIPKRLKESDKRYIEDYIIKALDNYERMKEKREKEER